VVTHPSTEIFLLHHEYITEKSIDKIDVIPFRKSHIKHISLPTTLPQIPKV